MRKHLWGAVLASFFLCFFSVHPGAAQPIVKLIATGGTIAMKIDPVKKAPVPAISGEDLLATVPEISKYTRVEVENIANVPSDYMDAKLWIAVYKAAETALARPEVAGVVVSHGTDTLSDVRMSPSPKTTFLM
jgi:L-asparaginase